MHRLARTLEHETRFERARTGLHQFRAITHPQHACPLLLNNHPSTCISALHGSQAFIHAHGLSAYKASTHLSSVLSPWLTSNHPCPWLVCMENIHAPIINAVSIAHKQPTMTMACLHRRPTPIYHQCCLHWWPATIHAHGLSAWKTNTHLASMLSPLLTSNHP